MAELHQVKQYLAYWFQLGKPLKFESGESVLPQPVIKGNAYSPAFEACWQQALTVGGQRCYLQGTEQTIGELLSGAWEISDCNRCKMPVPTLSVGVQANGACPCSDLPSWPSTDLPQPRSPVDSNTQLEQICFRLSQNQK